jgi:RNA polymerase sigma-70 factor (ECF subfamily)
MAPVADVEALYDEHAQALFAYLLNLTRNEADTRDLLQEVFVKVVRQPAILAGVHDPRGFLLRLAHNLTVDQLRRRTTRERSHQSLAQQEESVFAPAGEPDESSFRVALSGALQELPPDQRAVAHLKLWEGRTFEEIAEILEIPPNTAASRYRYAIDKLRARLRPIYAELKD